MFGDTRWTLIDAAREGDEVALSAFVEFYRAPVVSYLRRQGLGEEAEDLAQEVFLRLFRSQVLHKADPRRGRFRSLLLTITKRALASYFTHRYAEKRGSGKAPVPLEDIQVAAPESDEAFDQEWLTHLLSKALGRLAVEHPNYHQALELFLIKDLPQDQVAAQMGKSRGNIKNYVHRGRAKVLAYIREAVLCYSTSSAEYQEELRLLSRLLPPV